jgi:outer membrane protein OmpA-like peptidoglycan-associated protein
MMNGRRMVRIVNVFQSSFKASDKSGSITARSDPLQRSCSDSLKKRKLLQRRSINRGESTSVPSIVNEVLLSPGQPLARGTRAFMEPRFGYDFNKVRIHADFRAAESARSVDAHAYTVGQHMVFGEGKYSPWTRMGKRLIAHELTHVVQQSQDRVSNLSGSMNIGDPGNIDESEAEAIAEQVVTSSGDERTMMINNFSSSILQRFQAPPLCNDPSKVPQGLTNRCEVANDSPPSETEVLLFANNSSALTNQQKVQIYNFVLKWRAGGGNTDVRVDGYGSNSGSDERNWDLSCDRVSTVTNELILPSHPSSGTTVGIPINRIRRIAHCKTSEFGSEDQNRRASIFTVATTPPMIVGCQPPYHKATSFSEYLDLVSCTEQAFPGYTPRQILSLLRQIYYGHQQWSDSQASIWQNVIPCGLNIPDPRPTLMTLYKALIDSKVTSNTDMGHVFTGLESMVCPTPIVPLAAWGLIAANMPNEEFATWGGDIGSAAAQKVFDEQDQNMGPQPWNKYFGTKNTLASSEDLEGDIDGYAIRKGITGGACGQTAQTPISVSLPVSQILDEYYSALKTPIGNTRSSRFACFTQALGGIISGGKITNKSSLQGPISNRVFSFASNFYFGVLRPKIFGIPVPGGNNLGNLLISSIGMTKLFLDWLESRL